jgi:hypothetical protein
VEPPVEEVVLDSCAADPADATVDDDELAVVDVPESVEVPPSGTAGHDGPDWSPQLDCPYDPDVDAGGKEPLVERAATSVRIRPLAIDDDSDRNPVGGFRNQHLRELVSDGTGPETELVDVNRRGGRRDVRQHRWIEVPALDMNLSRRGEGLAEDEPEISLLYGRTKQLFGALAFRDPHALRLSL